MQITRKSIVSKILQEYPELTDLLMELGVCGCGHDSGYLWSVERIAKEKNLDLDELVEELNSRLSG